MPKPKNHEHNQMIHCLPRDALPGLHCRLSLSYSITEKHQVIEIATNDSPFPYIEKLLGCFYRVLLALKQGFDDFFPPFVPLTSQIIKQILILHKDNEPLLGTFMTVSFFSVCESVTKSERTQAQDSVSLELEGKGFLQQPPSVQWRKRGSRSPRGRKKRTPHSATVTHTSLLFCAPHTVRNTHNLQTHTQVSREETGTGPGKSGQAIRIQ